VTTREVEWDDQERARVLALLDVESQQCPGCRGWLPETTDNSNEGRYRASTPHRCHRCTAIQQKQAEYEKAKEPAALVMWPAELRG
jgi:hypothetical protein